MKYKQYETKIYFSKEDKIFYGQIENILDLVSFEGKTLFKVRKDFHKAVNDYLNFKREIQLERNLNKLKRWTVLEGNWNGYGSDPFSSEMITFAKKILNELEYQPEIFPVAGGAIQMEYETKMGEYLEFVTELNYSISVFGMCSSYKREDEFNITFSSQYVKEQFNQVIKEINDIVKLLYEGK